jgi:hypothetical protein
MWGNFFYFNFVRKKQLQLVIAKRLIVYKLTNALAKCSIN